MKLAFGYKCRSGKDTSCDYLQKKYGGQIFRIAGNLYKITGYCQEILGKPVLKDPELLQDLGLYFRKKYGQNIWIKSITKKIGKLNENTNIFIPDLRFFNECQALKNEGFKLVKIVRDNREVDRDNTHVSETQLDSYNDFDYIIVNNGSVEELYEKLDKLIEKLII